MSRPREPPPPPLNTYGISDDVLKVKEFHENLISVTFHFIVTQPLSRMRNHQDSTFLKDFSVIITKLSEQKNSQ